MRTMLLKDFPAESVSPLQYAVKVEKDVMIPMRGGLRVRTDAYYHDGAHPSHIVLPVIPGRADKGPAGRD